MITTPFEKYTLITSAILATIIIVLLIRNVFIAQAAVKIKNTNRTAFYRLPSHRSMMLHPKYWICWTSAQFGRRLK